ncbi:MarR family transcriptional regulator [Tsukamurella asaccharolytica]|uniref:MarR family transcriptional regulator n=1 Tax=Tsukamurella asaccharolytica TaxID=2592067 RepID=A0A5C5R9P8_9ACTN|nr:MarR family transcriptional regulator [Tsukamurella asaccharolytica]TWS19486.1 MarR family transcriptional regulator [Tsukamurella asaccharolytica]
MTRIGVEMDASAHLWEVPARTAFEAVCSADDLVMNVLTPALVEHDLTVEHFRALRLLAAVDGATVGEIAARTGTTPSSTTRLVDRLVERNLAYRRPAPADRRSILLTLSDTGREVWESLVLRLS